MNWLDIILAIILVIAAVGGLRSGLISQAFGIAGLLLGIWLGYRFSARLAVWFDMAAGWANFVSFIVILVAVILVSWLVGSLVRKVFRMTGFGILDNIGGLILGVVKVGLIMSLLLNLFVKFNDEVKAVNPRVFRESAIYPPLKKMSDKVFPWVLKSAAGLRDSSTEEGRTPKTMHI